MASKWNDDYMACPACNSMSIYRDLRDKINTCHHCGFTHFVDTETTQEALKRHNSRAPGQHPNGT